MPGTRIANEADDSKTLYRCQATEIPKATEQLRLRQVDQYIRGLRNWKLGKFLRGLPIELFNLWQTFSLRRLPARLRIAGGRRYPFVIGKLKKGETPSCQARSPSRRLRPDQAQGGDRGDAGRHELQSGSAL